MFATGMILVMAGVFLVTVLGEPSVRRVNAADTVGIVSAVIGIGLMAASLVRLAWRWMP